MLIRSTSFDYVTVGHVTVDVIAADGSRRPGGGAFYSALQAARLGLRALILTQGSAPEIEALLEPYRAELAVRILPAPASTTFETSWPGGQRRQRVRAWAGPIAGPVAVDTQILHFAPVARETPAAWRGHADFVGLTPQGLVRAWADGKIGAETGAETGAEVFAEPLRADRRSLEAVLPHGCSAVVISEQERDACAPLLDAAMAQGATVAITAGPGDTTVQSPRGKPTTGADDTTVRAPRGETVRVRASTVAAPRDDLGAGDVFAASFFVALNEGLSPERAVAFGNAAAAIRIEGSGASAIGDRRAIEARLTGTKT
jgi:hypothetical protein